jgi:proteasome lid subunit RPN8/RPN11
MTVAEQTLAHIRAHAQRDYPREACGLVIVEKGREVYVPCRNLAGAVDNFMIDPEDYARAEDRGEVLIVVHSHPNMPPEPSQADRVSCEQTRLPWLIVSWPTGEIVEFAPSGYVAPLIGRVFSHGVLDCYTLIRDYYAQELHIVLPDFERGEQWWLAGKNLYLDGFESAGFVRQAQESAPEHHDVLLMQAGSPVPNHGAVFLESGHIIHHNFGRLSSRDVFGGWYRKIHTHTLRHKSQLP